MDVNSHNIKQMVLDHSSSLAATDCFLMLCYVALQKLEPGKTRFSMSASERNPPSLASHSPWYGTREIFIERNETPEDRVSASRTREELLRLQRLRIDRTHLRLLRKAEALVGG